MKTHNGECERCGMAFSIVSNTSPRYCSDNCRKRACDERNRAVCPECGGPMGVGTTWSGKTPGLCNVCWTTTNAERTAERDCLIAGWWAAGESMNQICERTGWSVGQLGMEMNRIRERGNAALPYRRAPKDPSTDRRFRQVAA